MLSVAACRLRTLNLTKNRLTSLPPLNTNLDLNKVQELYLSRNAFSNPVMRVVSGYSRLKVLHLAQNELTEIYDELASPVSYCRFVSWRHFSKLFGLSVVMGGLSLRNVLFLQQNTVFNGTVYRKQIEIIHFWKGFVSSLVPLSKWRPCLVCFNSDTWFVIIWKTVYF